MHACSRRQERELDPNLSAEERAARCQVRRIRGFYSHLAAFVLVNAGLATINLLGSPGHLWFQWPLLGWGIGLLMHAFDTFGRQRFLGREWEERKVRELMAGKG